MLPSLFEHGTLLRTLVTLVRHQVAAYVAANETDKDQLEGSAKFFYALSTVVGTPNIPNRLALIAFQQQFTEVQTSVQKNVDCVLSAVAALRSNGNLRVVLKLILCVGNFLNGDSNKGKCYGFKLAALSQLKTTKSTDNKISLLHYIVQEVTRRFPEVHALGSELQVVIEAAKIDNAALRGETARVKRSLAQVNEGIATVEALQSVGKALDDRFPEVMTAFVARAQPLYDELERGMDQAEQECDEVAVLFGEEKGKLKWEQLFEKFASFVQSFQQAAQQLAKMKEVEEKNKKKEAEAVMAAKSQADRKAAKKDEERAKKKDLKKKAKLASMVGQALSGFGRTGSSGSSSSSSLSSSEVTLATKPASPTRLDAMLSSVGQS
jgi:diaphanous 1